jgi:hypothetical protein
LHRLLGWFELTGGDGRCALVMVGDNGAYCPFPGSLSEPVDWWGVVPHQACSGAGVWVLAGRPYRGVTLVFTCSSRLTSSYLGGFS